MKEQPVPTAVMTAGRVIGTFCVGLFAVLCWSAPNSAGKPIALDAESEIRTMVARYTESVSRADTELASQIWLNSPEVSFIHPLGHEHGFDEIKRDVYEHLMGEIFSERELTPRDISVHVYGDTAWAEFYWDFTAKARKDGSPVTSHGRETQIYTKVNGRWRLVHVHYSGMPTGS